MDYLRPAYLRMSVGQIGTIFEGRRPGRRIDETWQVPGTCCVSLMPRSVPIIGAHVPAVA